MRDWAGRAHRCKSMAEFRIFIVFFGVVFGGVIVAAAGVVWRRIWQARGWVETTGEIIESRLESRTLHRPGLARKRWSEISPSSGIAIPWPAAVSRRSG